MSEQGWRPIETLIESDEDILVYMPDDERHPIQVAAWKKNLKVIGNRFHFDACKPTHWMPTPAKPAKNEEVKP